MENTTFPGTQKGPILCVCVCVLSCYMLLYHITWLSHNLPWPRSDAQINQATREGENLYNQLVSNLCRARQFNKFTMAKSSRMFGWMSAQTDFVESISPHAPGKEAASEEPGLLACRVLRPLCSKQKQVLLLKDSSAGVVKFWLGVVFAVYRGSLAQSKSTPRKLKVSKALGINAPVESVARIMLVVLDKLDGEKGAYVASALSKTCLAMPHEEVIAELAIAGSGSQNGKIFFSLTEAAIKTLEDIESGSLNPLTIFIPPKSSNKASHESQNAGTSEPAAGFNILDFPKNEKGRKNLQSFFQQLPSVYAEKGIKLLNEKKMIKVGKEYQSWYTMSARCAIYFELMSGDGDKKVQSQNHSKGVFHRISQFLSFSLVLAVCWCLLLVS